MVLRPPFATARSKPTLCSTIVTSLRRPFAISQPISMITRKSSSFGTKAATMPIRSASTLWMFSSIRPFLSGGGCGSGHHSDPIDVPAPHRKDHTA
jgi:hypothetical protein